MAGKLIIFESVDHAGKTTQLNMIKAYLEKKHGKFYCNNNVIFTREPGGNGIQICEDIRKLILDPNNKMSSITEAYLYASCRAEHCIEIHQWLSEGKDVFCDRFVYSSYVYQGVGRGLGQKVEDINKAAIEDLMIEFPPDNIVYFKLPFEDYLKRKEGMVSLDRIEQNEIGFFKDVIEEYDNLFTKLKSSYNVIEIDATRTQQDIHEELLRKLQL
jgi:dTMP kinase